MARPASTLMLRPVPEGVASPDGRWLYVPAEHGGLDAVATASGELGWHRAGAALALLADAARVLVLQPSGDGRVRPGWLSAADGAAGRQPPGDVAPPLPHLAGEPGAWAVTASAWLDGRLLLAWSARQFGADKPAVAHGVLALDPSRLAQTADDSRWPPPPAWPGTAGETAFADAGMPLPPWAVQHETVALAVRDAGAGARALVLLRRDGSAGGAAVLVEDLPAPGWLQALASPEPSLVTLLCSRDAGDADPADGGASQWRFFAAPGGAPLATLVAEDGLLPPFYRIGDVLLARQLGTLANKRAQPGRLLRAWRLAAPGSDAQPLWQRPLPQHSAQRLG